MAREIGWIGLGRMGEAMVKRLTQAGSTVKVWNRPGGVTSRVYANFYVGGDHPISWNAFYAGANGVPEGDTYIGTIQTESITNNANTTKAELGFNNGSTNVTYCGYFVPNSASYSSGSC